MLFESKGSEIRSVGYNAITRELKIVFVNGDVKCFYDVPQNIYEAIKNNGGMVSSSVNEMLNGNYKSNIML